MTAGTYMTDMRADNYNNNNDNNSLPLFASNAGINAIFLLVFQTKFESRVESIVELVCRRREWLEH